MAENVEQVFRESALPLRAWGWLPWSSDWRRGTRWFLAEFLVVVTGVLCAFAVNGWAERQSEQRREVSYLVGLRSDFDTSRRDLGEVMALSTQSLASAEQLLRHTALGAGRVPVDSVLDAIRYLYAFNTFAPATGTYDNLILAGDLRFIRSAPLRTALAEWSGMLARNRVLEESMTEQFLIDSRYLTDAVSLREVWRLEQEGFLPGRHRTDVVALLADREFENIVIGRRWAAYEALEYNRRLLKHIDRILLLIRQTRRLPLPSPAHTS